MKDIVKNFLVFFTIFAFLFVRILPVDADELSPSPTSLPISSDASPTPLEPPITPTVSPTVSLTPTPEQTTITTGSVTNTTTVTTTKNVNEETMETKQVKTTQENNADVVTHIEQANTTGSNTIANSGNATIVTGDANVSATTITSVNTTMNDVKVSEFNVMDTHRGDIILSADTLQQHCIMGCSGREATQSATITQNNSVTMDNSFNLSANTGSNSSGFINGNSTITTGNVNIFANALFFANNNFANDVIVSTINIYGKLTGDIILPEFTSGDITPQRDKFNPESQQNDAMIINNLVIDANTGGNEANGNKDAASLTTGDITVSANVLNVVNNNSSNGGWWFVLINNAGDWVGKLIGSDTNTVAASEGTAFTFNDEKSVNSIAQHNAASVENTMSISANTGNNTTHDTSGDTTIITGNITIITSMINFVNNNFTGTGPIIFTIINIFDLGEWQGNFYDPDHSKKEPPLLPKSNEFVTPHTVSDSQDLQHEVREEKEQTGEEIQHSLSPSPTLLSSTRNASRTKKQHSREIAGIQTTNGKSHSGVIVAGKEKRKLRINLAWLLLLVPIGGIVLLKKIYFNKSSSLSPTSLR